MPSACEVADGADRRIVGCDKTVPAALTALARVDKPAVVLYSGPMRPGPNDVTIQDVWEAIPGPRATLDDQMGKVMDNVGRASPGLAHPLQIDTIAGARLHQRDQHEEDAPV